MNLLNEIQQGLKVPKAHSKPGLSYKYRNAEDILEAVKPLLEEKGTLILSDELVMVGDRYYVKATARLQDKALAAWEATAYAREELAKAGMDAAKITGAASSYARKYALNALFCIDDTKDADDDEPTPAKPAAVAKPAAKPIVKTAPPKSVVQQQQKAEIFQLCNDTAEAPLVTKEEYQTYVFNNTGLILSEENYSMIITRLTALKN